MQKNTKSVKSINPYKSVIQTTYDIVTKGHGGTIEVESLEGEEPKLIVTLPIEIANCLNHGWIGLKDYK